RRRARAEVAALRDLPGRDRTELRVMLVDAGDGQRVEVDGPRALRLRRSAECALRLRLLRHRSCDVDCVQRQPAGSRAHAGEVADGRDLRRGEAQLRGGDELIAGEMSARLTEVAEPEARRPVLLLELRALRRRQALEAAGARARA